jgi:type II secretory pathway component GspD/PulD (secretin)
MHVAARAGDGACGFFARKHRRICAPHEQTTVGPRIQAQTVLNAASFLRSMHRGDDPSPTAASITAASRPSDRCVLFRSSSSVSVTRSAAHLAFVQASWCFGGRCTRTLALAVLLAGRSSIDVQAQTSLDAASATNAPQVATDTASAPVLGAQAVDPNVVPTAVLPSEIATLCTAGEPARQFLESVAKRFGATLVIEAELADVEIVCAWPNPLHRDECLRLLNALLLPHACRAAWADDTFQTLIVRRTASREEARDGDSVIGVWAGERTSRTNAEGIAEPSTRTALSATRSKRVTRFLPLVASNPRDVGDAFRSLVDKTATMVALAEPAALVVDGTAVDVATIADAIDLLDHPSCGDRWNVFRPRSRDAEVVARLLKNLASDFKQFEVYADPIAQCFILRSSEAREPELLTCARLIDDCLVGAPETQQPVSASDAWSLTAVAVRACTAADAMQMLEAMLLRKLRAQLRMDVDPLNRWVFLAGDRSAAATARALIANLDATSDLTRPDPSRVETLILEVRSKDLEELGEKSRRLLQERRIPQPLDFKIDTVARCVALTGTDAALREGVKALRDAALPVERDQLIARVTRVIFSPHDMSSPWCTRLGATTMWLARGTPLEVAHSIGCAMVASLESQALDRENLARAHSSLYEARTVPVGGADLEQLQKVVVDEIARSERRNRGRDIAAQAAQQYVVLPDIGSQALLLAGRSDLVDRAYTTIATARGFAPKHWLTRIVNVDGNCRDALEQLQDLVSQQLTVPRNHRVPVPHVRIDARGTQAALGGDPAQVVALERYLRELCDQAKSAPSSLATQSSMPKRRAIAMVSMQLDDAVRIEKEWSEQSAASAQADLVVYADPETEVLCAIGPVPQLVELRSAMCGVMDDRTIVTEQGAPGTSSRAVDALMALSRRGGLSEGSSDAIPVLNQWSLPMVSQQFSSETLVCGDDNTGTIVLELPKSQQELAVAALRAMSEFVGPSIPKCALFEVIRGDVERLAQSLRGLAARGLLGNSESELVRPSDIVVQVVPETNLILVAGLQEHVDRARQSLMQSEALAVERVAIDVDAGLSDPESVRGRLMQALRSKASAPRRETAETAVGKSDPVREEGVRGTSVEAASAADTVEAVVDQERGVVRLSGTPTLLDAFREIRESSSEHENPHEHELPRAVRHDLAMPTQQSIESLSHASAADVARILQEVACLGTSRQRTACLATAMGSSVRFEGDALTQAVARVIIKALDAETDAIGDLEIVVVASALPEAVADALEVHHAITHTSTPARPLFVEPVAELGCLVLATRPEDISSWLAVATFCDPSTATTSDRVDAQKLWRLVRSTHGAASDLARVLGERGPRAELFAAADPRSNTLVLAGRRDEVRAAAELCQAIPEITRTKSARSSTTHILHCDLKDVEETAQLAERLLALRSETSHSCRISTDQPSGVVVVRGTPVEVAIVSAVIEALQQFERSPQSPLCCKVVPVSGVSESAASQAKSALDTQFDSTLRTTVVSEKARNTTSDTSTFVMIGAPDVVARSSEELLQRVGVQSAEPNASSASSPRVTATFAELLLLPLQSHASEAVAASLRELLAERAIWPASLQPAELGALAANDALRDPLIRLRTSTALGDERAAVVAVVPSELGALTRELTKRFEGLLALERGAGPRDVRIYPLFGRDAVAMAEAMEVESGSRDQAARVEAIPMPDASMLLLEDAAWRLDRVDAILAALDPRIARDAARMRVLPLANARATRLAPIVQSLVGGAHHTVTPETAAAAQATVLADTKANAILIEATPSVLDLAEAIVRELDVATDASTGRVLRILSTRRGDAASLARVFIDFFETDDGSEALPDIRSNAAGDALLLRANARQFEAIRALLAKRDTGVLRTRMLQRMTIDAARGDAAEMASRVLALVDPRAADVSASRTDRGLTALDGSMSTDVVDDANSVEVEGLAVACDAVTNSLYFLGTPEELARVEKVVAQTSRAIPVGSMVRSFSLPASIEPQQFADTVVATLGAMRTAPNAESALYDRVMIAAHPAERALLVLSNASDFSTVSALASVLTRAPVGESTRVEEVKVSPRGAERSRAVIERLSNGSNLPTQFRALFGGANASARVAERAEVASNEAVVGGAPVRMSGVLLPDQGAVLVCGANVAVEPTTRALHALAGTCPSLSNGESGSSDGVSIDVVPLRHLPATLAGSILNDVLMRGEPTRPMSSPRTSVEAVGTANTLVVRAVADEVRRALLTLDVAEAKSATKAQIVVAKHLSPERIAQALATEDIGENPRCITSVLPSNRPYSLASKGIVLLVGTQQAIEAACALVQALDVAPAPQPRPMDDESASQQTPPAAPHDDSAGREVDGTPVGPADGRSATAG